MRRQRPGPSKPGSPHGSGLGVFRWVVERTLAWLHRFRRLALRYERRADVHEAFLTLGCALITWRYLKVLKRTLRSARYLVRSPLMATSSWSVVNFPLMQSLCLVVL